MSFSDGNLDWTDLSATAGILGTQIADGTIQARNMADSAVLTNNISDGSITTTQIASNTITGDNIALNTINANNIAVGTITSNEIASNTITSANIAAGTITAANIASGTITGDNISALNLTGKNITADTGTIGGWALGETELIGANGVDIRSGQTAFNTGTGFWLGTIGGLPKFSIGTQGGNSMYWDGTNLVITGALTPTTVFNVITYTTANLPIPPTTVGFNPPSANQ